jgi:hypothetical protein
MTAWATPTRVLPGCVLLAVLIVLALSFFAGDEIKVGEVDPITKIRMIALRMV